MKKNRDKILSSDFKGKRSHCLIKDHNISTLRRKKFLKSNCRMICTSFAEN